MTGAAGMGNWTLALTSTRKRTLAAAAALCVAGSIGLLAVPAGPAANGAAAPLCGSMAGATPHITKVLWIFMENRSYGTAANEIPGDPSASYIDGSLLSQCGSTSDYHGASHPSYPNYLAATSGSTQGSVSDHLGFFTGPSIFSQVDPSWRSYEEFMPAGCDHIAMTGSATTGYYVGRHNPADSYSSLPVGAPTAGDCPKLDEPLGTATSGALEQDVAGGTLPEFSFVTPGLCDDMHNFPAGVSGCANVVKGGDTWLAKWIPIITSGPDYTSGHLLIDIAWDEGGGGTDGTDCTTASTSDCIVPNIVISPYTTHVVSGTDFSHYSLLKTTEDLLGLPLLGHAADASTNDMCAPFGLCPSGLPAPTASFTSSCTGLSCTFDGSGSSAPGSTITGYAWSFGDGGSGTGQTASHAYAAGGTYPVTLTVTNAQGLTGSATQQVTAGTGTAGPISFVASAGTAGNAATEKVTVPSTVTTGDGMLLVATGVATSALTGPAGWSLVGTESNSVMTTSVWSQVAAAGAAGQPVTVGFPGTVKGTVQLLAYAGTSTTAPVATFAAAAAHTTETSAATPAVTVPASGDWLVSYWTVKSSDVTSWTAPAGTVTRSTAFGTGGGQISSLAADGGGPATAGPGGGLKATAGQSFSADTAWSIVLAPAPSN
jgi:PKD repeat protein